MATSDSALFEPALFEPLTGNSVAVADHAGRYLITADAINDAALSLIRISGQQDAVGHAFDSVRELTDEVAGEIGQAEERYRATAQALAEYAVDLAAAQERANRAITAAGSAQGEAGTWASQVSTLQEEALVPGPEQLATQQRLTRAQSQLDQAEGAQAGAAAEYTAAVADKIDAAERASARIESVVKDSPLNDSMWSNIGGFLAGVGGWIADVLGAVIDVVAAAVDVIARLLVAVLIVVALAALLILVLATLGVGLGVLMVVLAVAVLASVALVGLALAAMAKERGTPTVKPTLTGTPSSPTDDPYATLFLEQSRIDGAGDIDGDGVADVGVISVMKVVGADGVTRWRVQIPSTQEWSPFADDAPNDLNSDLVAKLNPAQRTQLEKAVEAALLQAGYTSGDPTMLAGFSLGGITAGNLAADTDFAAAFNVQAVVTGGAPLDDVYIGPDISVISLEHNSDPVANVGDLLAGHPTEANRIVIDIDAPAQLPSDFNLNGTPPTPAPLGHGAVDYAVSAGEHITRSTDPRVVAARDRSAEFFGGTETYIDYSVTRG
ncbi:hypothetical protein D6T64_10485 [Cryobacterium melibiosiphilum]|uniref:Uncharacterized protein n=1 Tax=Cryobacterium melibiosiphilum TaxID=995039 RepID=A0A3A5MHJ9_9MICO|nr:hypothetical protein [Cryobacterium melibiosiphilum]RJT88545.1 hypothetical protein D6T64_10485 [Cryobacterium melibiosiphilum]